MNAAASASSSTITTSPVDPAGILSVGSIITLLFNRNREFTAELMASVAPKARFRSRIAETLWPKVTDLTLVDQFRADQLAWYFEQALGQPGDIIECGVYRGGVSLLLASILREFGIRKKVYLLDSFGGLPAPDRRYDAYYSAGWLRSDQKAVQDQIDRRGLAGYCVVKKGWFEDTLKEFDAGHRFCFVHVDCDLYSSCMDCLTQLYPKLVDGCPMVFDDYYDSSGGVQKAVDAWTAKAAEVVHLGPAPQATVIKGMTAETPGVRTWKPANATGPIYSTTHLEGNQAYMSFLAGMTDLMQELAVDFGRFSRTMSGQRDGDGSLHSPALPKVFQALLGNRDKA
jgi:hypothetical protein